MFSFLYRQWFLIVLTLLIVLGISLGHRFPVGHKQLADAINPLITTGLILFLMSFSLETRRLHAALMSPFPVAIASVLNVGLAPTLGLALMPLQTLPDFRYGLLVAAAVPCTMAAASVWTRKAHGNDAISLLVTLVTNLASVATIPFWLSQAAHWMPLTNPDGLAAALPTGGLINLEQTVKELVFGVLVPIFLGQGCRQVPQLGEWANRHKGQISMASQLLILLMVWTAAAKGGVRLSQTELSISLSSVFLVWASVIIIHLVTLYTGLYFSRGFRVHRPDQIAVALAGSQKTLPVGLLVSEALSRQVGLSFAVFPMLMFHASQLFLDTIVVDRFLAEEQKTAHQQQPAP